jgi:hypothetical protein
VKNDSCVCLQIVSLSKPTISYIIKFHDLTDGGDRSLISDLGSVGVQTAYYNVLSSLSWDPLQTEDKDDLQ